MSPDGVHEDEMPKLPRDDPWPSGDPALASFAEDLRIVACGPAPEPRPGLVAVMRQGPTIPPPTPAGRNKMLVKTFLGSLVAKVAMGVSVATASVTAAGAAGVLPEPAQEAVASVVAAATPFELPDGSDTGLKVAKDVLSSTTSTTLAGGDDDDVDADDDIVAGDGERKANHGACVSTAAKDKTESASGNHGKTVSSVARSDCGKTDTSTSATVVSSITSATDSSSTTTSLGSGARSANSGRGNSGNSGSGAGNSGSSRGGGIGNSGNGGGNSGK